jgi:hypothetical protein
MAFLRLFSIRRAIERHPKWQKTGFSRVNSMKNGQ